MSDRLTRTLAAVALSISLVAIVLSGYAVWLHAARTRELEDLSDSLRRALEARPVRATALRPPPPELDDGVD